MQAARPAPAVLATAIVFFRRFYLRNSYCETDPALVAAACCYVAAKAEETPVHVKSAVGEAKVVFNGALFAPPLSRLDDLDLTSEA